LVFTLLWLVANHWASSRMRLVIKWWVSTGGMTRTSTLGFMDGATRRTTMGFISHLTRTEKVGFINHLTLTASMGFILLVDAHIITSRQHKHWFSSFFKRFFMDVQ